MELIFFTSEGNTRHYLVLHPWKRDLLTTVILIKNNLVTAASSRVDLHIDRTTI
jgi:hypothetical protein